MRRRASVLNTLAAVAPVATGPAALSPAAAQESVPRAPALVGRAIQAYEPAPPVPQPQPRGGYSALVDGPGGTRWAVPDNGYGGKGNSCNFVLRVDRVRIDPIRSGDAAAPGTIELLSSVQLRDPDGLVPSPIYRQGSADRLLTGWDFDPESFRVDRKGTWWFGDEFGRTS